LYGVPQRAEFHPEVDTGIHVEMVLDMAAQLVPGNALIGWCALTHDLGKALTPADVLPKHIGHEHAGVAPLRALAARMRVPADYAALAELVCRLHLLAHTAFELRPETLLQLFEKLDAFRQPKRVSLFLLACEADKRGRLGKQDDAYPQASYLKAVFAAALEPKAQPLLERGLSGIELGDALRQARLEAVAAAMQSYKAQAS
jgi:tRNA nucleotidyltransferase (CCA-adding enzyme)